MTEPVLSSFPSLRSKDLLVSITATETRHNSKYPQQQGITRTLSVAGQQTIVKTRHHGSPPDALSIDTLERITCLGSVVAFV